MRNIADVIGEDKNHTGTCLAFDYGTKHIGLAVGEIQIQSARPLVAVANKHGTPDWNGIKLQVEQWQPSDLVLGWPLGEDGQEQPLCNHVKGFAKRLQQMFDLPVHLVDERFSSIAAQEQIKSMRQSGQRTRRSKHTDVDCVAAALILETWFTQNSE
ncbi:MAG: Holliday junction resolvase RuvX [Granulosicoccus sp.]